VAYFADRQYFDDPETIKRGTEFGEGKLILDWYEIENDRVRCTPSDPRRGLTYEDCSKGAYSWDLLPEFVRHNYSMAARGSVLVPGLPDMGYTENRKSDIWADNIGELYEESKSRRWAPAVDIDWKALAATDFDPAVTASMCQLCTTLSEVSLVGMEFPSRWVYLVNQEFLELKSLLCAQMMDQARAVEVFRKRALSSGGLKRASANVQQALKELLMADNYIEGSIGINLLVGSLLLGVYRVAATASTIDAHLFRRCQQDAARRVAYGMGNLAYHLAHREGRQEVLNEYLDLVEHCFAGIAGATEMLEPLIVIAGGGTEPGQVASGRARVASIYRVVVDEYLGRLAAAGLERRDRSRLPAFFAAA